MGIQNVLKLFYTYSGLQLNSGKSELFYTGIAQPVIEEIRSATGFQIGHLPVRYLGVPLITRRLTLGDCSMLIDKITARIQCWITKYLTYAGRLQLIKSVLYSIQSYWCRQFILPKGVIKRVNQLCSNFFWKGNDKPSKGARISWYDICHPKVEGGLGLKDTLSWNKACVMQNIWSIMVKAGSLWIAWIEAYVLKGRSFWEISASTSNSWNWRKLLQLRTWANRFVDW